MRIINSLKCWLDRIIFSAQSGCSLDYQDMRSRSSYFKNNKFINSVRPPNKNLWHLILSRIKDRWYPWPKQVECSCCASPIEKFDVEAIKVTFINHATFLIQVGGLNIITDPIYSKRCAPFSFLGPKGSFSDKLPGRLFFDECLFE